MQPILYAITDPELLPDDSLFEGVAAALRGGCRWVQYRDKKNSAEVRAENARQLVNLCNSYNAKLIINDDVELTQKVNAHGVHLGQTDMNPIAARIILGNQAIIGVTCHDSLELARTAIANTATYIAFGRFFSSQTKPSAGYAPISLLADARRKFKDFPIVAIGGITADNAKLILSAGATMIAVCHSLFSAEDITAQTKTFIELSP